MGGLRRGGAEPFAQAVKEITEVGDHIRVHRQHLRCPGRRPNLIGGDRWWGHPWN